MTVQETALTLLTFDPSSGYTHWQRMEMLFTNTPLLTSLHAVLLATYKKVVEPVRETTLSHDI